jgi:hypothetical protein
MAQEQVIISVDIDLGKTEQSLQNVSSRIADLRIKQQELKDQYKALAISEDYYVQESKKLSVELSNLTRQQTNLTTAMLSAGKTNEDYGDSLDGMRAKLNDMQRAYATLSKEQRDSAGGKAFLENIKAQDKAVKELEQSIGDARRNVGDYEGAIKRAFPSIGKMSDGIEKTTETFEALGKGGAAAMKSLVVGLGNATKAALKFIATPIGAVLAAVVAAIGLLTAGFKKLQDAFAKNDEAGTNWAKLMASFEPIIDGVSRAFDKLAQGIGKVASKIADWIGSNNEAAKAAQNLVIAVDNLEQAERDYTVNSAERNKQIAELRAKATQTEKYSAEERIAALNEAMNLEKQNLEDQKTIAAERLRILEETAEKESDTSDETANKIAQARAALYQAEEQYYSGTRRLLSQLNSAEKEIAAERAQRKQTAMEEAFRIYEEELDRIELLNEGLQALAGVEEERARIKRETEEELARLREEAESYVEEEEEVEVASIEDIVRDKFGIDEEAIAYFNELLESGMSGLQAFEKMETYVAKKGAESFAEMAGSLSGSFHTMSDLLNTYGEDNENAAKAAKAFALSGIITGQAQSIANTALSISNSVAGATAAAAATGPAAPFVLGSYIASMVGAVLAQLASTAAAFMEAKQLLSGEDAGAFASGGIVSGTSYTGDRLHARVNSSEMILTREQQARLFEIANTPMATGGFDYEALAAAMASQPAPVMDYTEFRQFEQKVSTFNEIAKI